MCNVHLLSYMFKLLLRITHYMLASKIWVSKQMMQQLDGSSDPVPPIQALTVAVTVTVSFSVVVAVTVCVTVNI